MFTFNAAHQIRHWGWLFCMNILYYSFYLKNVDMSVDCFETTQIYQNIVKDK